MYNISYQVVRARKWFFTEINSVSPNYKFANILLKPPMKACRLLKPYVYMHGKGQSSHSNNNNIKDASLTEFAALWKYAMNM